MADGDNGRCNDNRIPTHGLPDGVSEFVAATKQVPSRSTSAARVGSRSQQGRKPLGWQERCSLRAGQREGGALGLSGLVAVNAEGIRNLQHVGSPTPVKGRLVKWQRRSHL
jgi:hypothetical protein